MLWRLLRCVLVIICLVDLALSCVQGFRTPLWLVLRLFPVQPRPRRRDGGGLFLLGVCLVGLSRGYRECVVHLMPPGVAPVYNRIESWAISEELSIASIFKREAPGPPGG